MADIRVSEYTKISGVERGSLVDGMADREASMVYLWDAGPTAPTQPKRPIPPRGKEGEPEYDLAVIDFREALSVYEAELKAFSARKAEYARWEAQVGGAEEIKMWSVDARDALDRDSLAVKEKRQSSRRYFISARTRGFGSLPNGGLPDNMKPGARHFANLERERDGDSDLAAARRADPVFGAQETRA